MQSVPGCKSISYVLHRPLLLPPLFLLIVAWCLWSSSTVVLYSASQARIHLWHCVSCIHIDLGLTASESDPGSSLGSSTNIKELALRRQVSHNVQDGRGQEAAKAGPLKKSLGQARHGDLEREQTEDHRQVETMISEKERVGKEVDDRISKVGILDGTKMQFDVYHTPQALGKLVSADFGERAVKKISAKETLPEKERRVISEGREKVNWHAILGIGEKVVELGTGVAEKRELKSTNSSCASKNIEGEILDSVEMIHRPGRGTTPVEESLKGESERAREELSEETVADPVERGAMEAGEIVKTIRSVSLPMPTAGTDRSAAIASRHPGNSAVQQDPLGGKEEAFEMTMVNSASSCQGKYVYVYDLPPHFNLELLQMCHMLLPWYNLCDYLSNSGLGKPVTGTQSKILIPAGRWFNTHQYALELVSHARILEYQCLTSDSALASLFYVPYYGGLDVIRWHFSDNTTHEKRDALGWQLVEWLEKQPSWKRRGGLDHVLVLGKISWDFRRPNDESGMWGSRLLEFPQMQNLTKVLIERNPWHQNDIGAPHPTFFHPKSDTDVRAWQAHVAASQRRNLVSFAGKDRRNDPENIRTLLIQQCVGQPEHCYFLECVEDLCLRPEATTKVFMTSHFCMQPPGDSPTRRSVFDSLIAGCIPVLFDPYTAYLQYPWHLPANTSSYSVYLADKDLQRGRSNVVEVLKRISEDERDRMRRHIITDIVPGLLYAEPGAQLSTFKDAFAITLDNLLHRVSSLNAFEQTF